MQIYVDDQNRRITFLYKLEDGIAEGSFGMHCASMCGIPAKVVDRAEQAAKEWEHTSRLKEKMDRARCAATGGSTTVPLGVLSDVAWILKGSDDERTVSERSFGVLLKAIERL